MVTDLEAESMNPAFWQIVVKDDSNDRIVFFII